MKLIADSMLSSSKLVASITNSSSSVSIKSNTQTTNSFFWPESGRLRSFKNSLSFSTVHRLIILRNGIGNAIHCPSIIIVSLAYDIIMMSYSACYRDGHGFIERT